jgi:hypothetical protein
MVETSRLIYIILEMNLEIVPEVSYLVIIFNLLVNMFISILVILGHR